MSCLQLQLEVGAKLNNDFSQNLKYVFLNGFSRSCLTYDEAEAKRKVLLQNEAKAGPDFHISNLQLKLEAIEKRPFRKPQLSCTSFTQGGRNLMSMPSAGFEPATERL